MPVIEEQQGHREKLDTILDPYVFYACVARPVPYSEMRTKPAAHKVMQAEWDRLRAVGKHGVWNESAVRPKQEVIDEARLKGKKIQIGQLMVCVEKNHDIPGQSKYKGRVVYRGDCVKDEWGQLALFKDMASCPATLEAAKIADMISCAPGCKGEQADAQQAYTQALFQGHRNLGGYSQIAVARRLATQRT